jgi:hypothetical protein
MHNLRPQRERQVNPTWRTAPFVHCVQIPPQEDLGNSGREGGQEDSIFFFFFGRFLFSFKEEKQQLLFKPLNKLFTLLPHVRQNWEVWRCTLNGNIILSLCYY